jgi:hypothetical protein
VEEMPGGSSRGGGSKVLERRLVRIYSPGTAVEGLLAVSTVAVAVLLQYQSITAAATVVQQLLAQARL